MKNYHYLFFLVILIFVRSNVAFSGTLALDSVGLVNKNGGKYIVHEVIAGETLFALSRKYGVDTQAIKDANSDDVSNLAIGQRVLVPFRKIDEQKWEIHKVKPSETLFSISRQYDVKVDDLIKWNNLTDNSISIGQMLKVSFKSGSDIDIERNIDNEKRRTHLVEKSQTLYAISRMYQVTPAQLRSWNKLSSDELNIGQVLVVSEEADEVDKSSNSSMLPINKQEKQPADKIPSAGATTPAQTLVSAETVKTTEPKTIEESDMPAEKVVQKGFAEVIDNSNETKKYLALHRDAQIGTIMQVRNEMNNQSVFVRIVGTIPATGDNAKVILKISKKAYDRLGAVDSRFPVEVSYIP
ncbi:MAG: LysM peptidoglycan-binding domain-containing protein [Cyclobacteriaceae bacterium]|nr:LysM peptidoglycan-binding domain-containing protein [Cyclobacteriaceae bacterium]